MAVDDALDDDDNPVLEPDPEHDEEELRMAMPEAGDPAPAFALSDQSGETVTLADLRGRLGRPLLLSARRHTRLHDPGLQRPRPLRRVRRRGARVLGVSPDEVDAVAKFDDKYDLGFTLLADPDHAVADAYGTWVEKSITARRTWACSARPSSSIPRARSPRCSRRSAEDARRRLVALAELLRLGEART